LNKFFAAIEAWERAPKDSADGPREHFLRGFLTGFDAATDDTDALLGRLDAMFTAARVAGRAHLQSGAEVPRSALSREMQGSLASARSVVEMPPQPSEDRGVTHEVRERLRVERQPEGPRTLLDRVLANLKRYSFALGFRW